MQNKELIFGAFGQTNIGDELLLLGYLKNSDLKTKYIVVSFNPKFSNKFYSKSKFSHKVNFIGTNELFKILKAMISCNKVIFCGGTLLKTLPSTVTNFSYQSIIKVLGVTIISKIFAKQIYSYGIGISPFKDRLSLALAKMSLLLNSKVEFRDSKSYEMYSGKNGYLKQDLVYNLKDDIIKNPSKGTKYDLAINLCHNTKTKYYLNDSIKYCKKLINENKGKNIIFISMQSGFEANNDYQIGLRLQQEFPFLIVKSPDSFEELILLIKNSRSLYVMRFHLGVLSDILDKEFKIFNYDPKISNWAHDMNLQKNVIEIRS